MDIDQARTALLSQRDEVSRLLDEQRGLQQEDERTPGQAGEDPGDVADTAQPLETQAVDSAIADGLQEKLDAIERALTRIEDGTYGRSVRSGEVIPDARLEADPAAELTVEEAAADERR